MKDAVTAPHGKSNSKELEMAEKFIEALSDEFKPEKFHDDYREKLEKLIEVKSEGGDISKVVGGDEEAPEPRVINLMDALQKSLEQAKRGKKPAAASHAPRRRKSA